MLINYEQKQKKKRCCCRTKRARVARRLARPVCASRACEAAHVARERCVTFPSARILHAISAALGARDVPATHEAAPVAREMRATHSSCARGWACRAHLSCDRGGLARARCACRALLQHVPVAPWHFSSLPFPTCRGGHFT